MQVLVEAGGQDLRPGCPPRPVGPPGPAEGQDPPSATDSEPLAALSRSAPHTQTLGDTDTVYFARGPSSRGPALPVTLPGRAWGPPRLSAGSLVGNEAARVAASSPRATLFHLNVSLLE